MKRGCSDLGAIVGSLSGMGNGASAVLSARHARLDTVGGRPSSPILTIFQLWLAICSREYLPASSYALAPLKDSNEIESLFLG